jgi:hypothetical protein
MQPRGQGMNLALTERGGTETQDRWHADIGDHFIERSISPKQVRVRTGARASGGRRQVRIGGWM